TPKPAPTPKPIPVPEPSEAPESNNHNPNHPESQKGFKDKAIQWAKVLASTLNAINKFTPVAMGTGFLWGFFEDEIVAVMNWIIDVAIAAGKWIGDKAIAAGNWLLNKTVAGWNIAWNFTKSKALAALNKVIAVGYDLFDVGTVKLDQVQLTDQQARQLSDLVYKDIHGLTDDDLIQIFGKDENGNPNATIIDRIDTTTGFEAIAVKNWATNEVIIAFRGSDTEDGFIDWWGQNLSIWQQFKGPQIDEADQFIERVINSDEAKGSTIILTGHSKGGFHAQDGAKKYGFPAITFNAPGLKPHPFHKVNPVQLAKTTVNPYM